MKYNFSSRLQKVHDYVEIKKKFLAKTHISFIINVTIWKTILLVKMEYRLFGKSGTSCTEHKRHSVPCPQPLEEQKHFVIHGYQSYNISISMDEAIAGQLLRPLIWNNTISYRAVEIFVLMTLKGMILIPYQGRLCEVMRVF